MALSDLQVAELNAAYNRTGGQTAKDIENINYAKTQGWTPPVAPTVPVNDGYGGAGFSGVYDPGNPSAGGTGAPTTTVVTPKTKTAAEIAMDNLSTAQNSDARRAEIANQLAAARAARASAAESIFGEKMNRANTVGEQQLNATRGVQGQTAGFNMSTANLAFMNSVQKNIEDKKGEIMKQKQEYIDSGNYEAMKRADDALAKLDDTNLQILLKKADWAINSEQQQTENQLNIAGLQLKIPTGQSVNIGGVDYKGLAADEGIFKGSDLVSLMSKIPAGTTQTITDPSTGQTYTLTGLSQGDINVATDNAGYQYGIDKNTGKTLWKSATPVGKSGGSGTNVSVTMPSYSQTPYYVDGKQAGYVRFDSKSNKNVIFSTADNKEIPELPKGATLGTFSAGNPDTSGVNIDAAAE